MSDNGSKRASSGAVSKPIAVLAVDVGTSGAIAAAGVLGRPDQINLTQATLGRAKHPTALLLHAKDGPKLPDGTFEWRRGDFIAFGNQALAEYKSADPQHPPELDYLHYFKMALYEQQRRTLDQKLPSPVSPVDNDDLGSSVGDIDLFSAGGRLVSGKLVFARTIQYLVQEGMKLLPGIFPEETLVMITVPAIWDLKARQFMREAAIAAGLREDRVKIALESEVAALSCRNRADGGKQISDGDTVLVLDIGGGTADMTVHTMRPDGAVDQKCPPDGGDWGSTRVNEHFLDLLRNRLPPGTVDRFLQDHPYDGVKLMENFDTVKCDVKPTPPLFNGPHKIQLPQSLLALAGLSGLGRKRVPLRPIPRPGAFTPTPAASAPHKPPHGPMPTPAPSASTPSAATSAPGASAPAAATPAPGATAPASATPAPSASTPAAATSPPGATTPAPGATTPAPGASTPAPGPMPTPVPGATAPEAADATPTTAAAATPAPGASTPAPGASTPEAAGVTPITAAASNDSVKALNTSTVDPSMASMVTQKREEFAPPDGAGAAIGMHELSTDEEFVVVETPTPAVPDAKADVTLSTDATLSTPITPSVATIAPVTSAIVTSASMTSEAAPSAAVPTAESLSSMAISSSPAVPVPPVTAVLAASAAVPTPNTAVPAVPAATVTPMTAAPASNAAVPAVPAATVTPMTAAPAQNAAVPAVSAATVTPMTAAPAQNPVRTQVPTESVDVALRGEYVELSHACMLSLFETPLVHICEKVRSLLLQVPQINKVCMVGGFSNSPVLQKRVQAVVDQVLSMKPSSMNDDAKGAKDGKHSSDRRRIDVLRAADPMLCVVKGAVLYGMDERIIKSRVLEHTYGIAVSSRWRDDVHGVQGRKKVMMRQNGQLVPHVVDRFYAFRYSGDSIPHDDVFRKKFGVVEDDQEKMAIRVYRSPSVNTEYVDAPEAELVGDVLVLMPDKTGGLTRNVHISFRFGGTQLHVEAEDLTSGTPTSAIFRNVSFRRPNQHI